jgi:NAD(P)-dependent dehydrogenase (short-subunit alcohol dehydrogenase family)
MPPDRRAEPAEWRAFMAVNLDGAFLTLKAAMAAMRGDGLDRAHRIRGGLKAEPGSPLMPPPRRP